MRVPESIRGTDYVYKAMFAMLLAVIKFNKKHSNVIKSVACPGLGTFFGEMDPEEAARLMGIWFLILILISSVGIPKCSESTKGN